MPAKRRVDPVFGLPTPLLFAHRGGAKEQPESTLPAFDYACRDVRVDVLELDVQVTRDDPPRFVVWHGPELLGARRPAGGAPFAAATSRSPVASSLARW